MASVGDLLEKGTRMIHPGGGDRLPRRSSFLRVLGVGLMCALTLLASACFDSQEPAAPAEGGQGNPVSTGNPLQGGGGGGPDQGAGSSPGGPDNTLEGDPPEPGEPTTTTYEVLGQGTDRVEERFLPQALLARSAEEGQRSAGATPAPGVARFFTEWDDYDDRAVVAVLGGSQPDPTHRVVVTGVAVLKQGSVLVVSARIVRGRRAPEEISIPWVALAVEADAADTVERCTLSLEGTTPFTTRCG